MITDNKKIISRLIVQKILQHEICRFLDKGRYEDLSRLFLSDEPDKELRLDLKLQNMNDKYYQNVADVTLRWTTDDLEKMDPEGNVWLLYQLKITSGVSSRWNATVSEMTARAECMAALASLLGEIHEMVGHPLQIQVLSNEERVARDRKRMYDAACDDINKLIRWQMPELRRGLRLGGKSRTFERERLSKITVEPGKYEFETNDGSNKKPLIKRYLVTIPENPLYLCTIRRIA